MEEKKIKLRKQALEHRDQTKAKLWNAEFDLLKLFTSSFYPKSGNIISGYYPIGSELSPLPLLTELSLSQYEIVLPVMVGKRKPLLFRQWLPGDSLLGGGFGVREPLKSARELIPNILIIPLLAFDRKGNRLGYGGGFYDRTLKNLRTLGEPIAIGIGFSTQEVDMVPVSENDQSLNWIVTEREAIEIGD